MLKYKAKNGFNKNEKFIRATWKDIDAVFALLEKFSVDIEDIDKTAADFIFNETIPLIKSYIYILKNTDLPASVFFDKDFTIDTGSICNMGNGISEYKALTEKQNMPITPQHEIIYGAKGRISIEMKVWRLAPEYKNGAFSLVAEAQNLSNSSISKNDCFNKIEDRFQFALDENFLIDTDRNDYRMPGTKGK